MSDLIFLLILFVFVLILSATPLFRKSRSQRDYESSGMQLLATSRGRVRAVAEMPIALRKFRREIRFGFLVAGKASGALN